MPGILSLSIPEPITCNATREKLEVVQTKFHLKSAFYIGDSQRED